MYVVSCNFVMLSKNISPNIGDENNNNLVLKEPCSTSKNISPNIGDENEDNGKDWFIKLRSKNISPNIGDENSYSFQSLLLVLQVRTYLRI